MTVEEYYRTYNTEVLVISHDAAEMVADDTKRLLARIGQEFSPTAPTPTFPKRLLDRTCGTLGDF